MKKLIGILVILAVIVLGSYYGTGMLTEKALKKDVNVVNQSNGLYVEIKDYQRRWFDSTADFVWKITLPERVSKDSQGQPKVLPSRTYTLNMPLEIHHGPVIFAKDGVHFGFGYASSELTIPQELQQQIGEQFTQSSTLPQVDMSVLVNHMNRSRFSINLPEFELVSKDGEGKFDWMGMKSHVTLTSKLDHINGDMKLAGVDVEKREMKASIRDVESEYDLYQSEGGLYLGQASLSLPSIMVQNKDKKIFELVKLYIHSKSEVDEGLFHSFLKASLDSIYSQGKTYGPGLFKISIKNLDAEVLAKINKLANQMQNSSEAEKQKAMFAILPELPKLLSKGPEIEISQLSFNLPDGKIEGSLELSLPEGEMTNPFQAIQRLQGNAKLELPQEIVKEGLKEAAKQQLVKKPTLQDALTQQIKQQASANSADGSSTSSQEVPTSGQDTESDMNPNAQLDMSNDASQAINNQEANDALSQAQQTVSATGQMTLADLDNQAEQKASQKINDLLQAGVIQKQGDDFVIALNLKEGQLTINGKPFNPSMIQF